MKYINQMHAHAYTLTCLFHLSTLGMISKLQSKLRHLLVGPHLQIFCNASTTESSPVIRSKARLYVFFSSKAATMARATSSRGILP